MSDAMPGRWRTPAADSLLGRWLARRARHPQEFDCAVRVMSGDVPGESTRWRYRRSAVDPYLGLDAGVTLNHGPQVRLQLRFTGEQRAGGGVLRPHHVIWPATELATGAEIEVAADAGEAVRLHLD